MLALLFATPAYCNGQVAEVPELTQTEKMKIMEIIESLDYTLYQELVAVDPMGVEHIQADKERGAAVMPSIEDGLPIFAVSARALKLPARELRFILAHELGHYVLRHYIQDFEYNVCHRALTKQPKLPGKLSFEDAFHYAYDRTVEDEADRFAIIEFRINVDDAIALAERWRLEVQEDELRNPEKKTFQRGHPLWATRIQHLNALRGEVELRRAKNLLPTPINWKALAKENLEFCQKWAEANLP